MKKFFTGMTFYNRPWVWKVTLVLALLAAFGLRMINLTNPPLDFASTRQLFSALKARGMYYQYATNVSETTRQLAISLGNVGIVEPPVMEEVVAQTYRLTGEHLWIARIYSSLFWVLGGLALFLLIRELASTGAAMIAALYYLFLPFGVIASRAFMPDPLMVGLICFSLWALFRWQVTASWKWAILFGVFAGAALFIKNLAVFVIVGGFAGVIFGVRGLKRSIRDLQVWVMAILLVLPVAIFMVYGTLKLDMGSQLALRFFPNLWIDPAFYFRWAYTVNFNIGWVAVLFALFSIFLADPKRERPLLIGMWIGYLLFGMTFPYHFYTHDYYQLSLIPLVAISMAPGLRLVLNRFFELSPGILPRLVLVAIVLVGVIVPSWYSRDQMVNTDYHNEPAFWAKLGDLLGHDQSVVALSQDYGYRLAYWGWQGSTNWFTSADIGVRYLAGQNVDLMQQFKQDTAGKTRFLVTMFSEFDKQPTVKDLLNTHYPILAKTDEYIIYDLQHPLAP
ncbi:MAG TPA: glycosyltransferase family 39 protein [Anaerolineales bacterium]|nr:glycosyltransferase family 39 protein [Anaerolineales bacterium]